MKKLENELRLAAVQTIDVAFSVATWRGWPGPLARPLLRVALRLVTLGAWILDGLQEESP